MARLQSCRRHRPRGRARMRRASAAPTQSSATAPATARQGELADRRLRPAAHVVAAARDARSARHRQGHEAALEAAARQPAAADAQPVSAADRRQRQTAARAEGDRASSPASRTTSTASTSRPARSSGRGTSTARSPSQADGRGGGTLCPGGLTATPVLGPDRRPGKYIAYAVSWDGRLRQLDVATGEDAAPAELVPAAERQAVRPEPRQERDLHDDRAGLRRQPEQVLLLRSRDEEGRQLQPGQRRHVAAARAVGRQGRHASTPAAATATTIPEQQIYGQAIIAVKQNPDDQGARAEGLVHAVQRLLAAQARPRHERHRPGLRLQGQGIHCAESSKECRIWLLDTSAHGRRGPSHAGLPHAAHLQRGGELRGGRRLGRAGHLGGHRRHALGADAVLGPEASAVQGADRARPGRARRRRGVQGRRARPARSGWRRPGSRAT